MTYPSPGVGVPATPTKMYGGISRRVDLGRVDTLIPLPEPSANFESHRTTSQLTGWPLAQGGARVLGHELGFFDFEAHYAFGNVISTRLVTRIIIVPLELRNASLAHPDTSSTPVNFEAAEKSSVCTA